MSDDTSIRPAESHENEVLSDLAFRSKAFWGYSAEFMSICREELSISAEDIRNPNRTYIIYEFNGTIAGYYGLDRVSEVEFELEALFVEPSLIGGGFGRALLQHAKAIARAAGAQSILIQGDPNATKFYESAGAVHVGERESDSFPGRFLPVFEINLLAES